MLYWKSNNNIKTTKHQIILISECWFWTKKMAFFESRFLSSFWKAYFFKALKLAVTQINLWSVIRPRLWLCWVLSKSQYNCNDHIRLCNDLSNVPACSPGLAIPSIILPLYTSIASASNWPNIHQICTIEHKRTKSKSKEE